MKLQGPDRRVVVVGHEVDEAQEGGAEVFAVLEVVGLQVAIVEEEEGEGVEAA